MDEMNDEKRKPLKTIPLPEIVKTLHKELKAEKEALMKSVRDLQKKKTLMWAHIETSIGVFEKSQIDDAGENLEVFEE